MNSSTSSFTVNSELFERVLFSRNFAYFVKIKPSRNGEISLLFTDIGKSCPSREFLMSQVCILTVFAKIKFPRKLNSRENFRIYSNKGFKVQPREICKI